MTIAIYVDVDDTLIRSAGTKRIPIPATIQQIRQLHQEGATLFCWSAGGADYARATAETCGIAHCFTAFLPKPNLLIDDQNITDWPRCAAVHPSTCQGQKLAELTKIFYKQSENRI